VVNSASWSAPAVTTAQENTHCESVITLSVCVKHVSGEREREREREQA